MGKPKNPVRDLRTRANFTQAELAFRAGLTPGTVSLVERCPGLLRPHAAALLASALGVDASALLVARRLNPIARLRSIRC
jgi:transcriptional regulator with XRE-family HTH domain